MNNKINEVLKTIVDPEIFIDIITLGLVYNIKEEKGNVKIEMTLTTPMCPYGDQLVDNIKIKVGQIEGVKNVDVQLVFDPPWEPPEEIKLMMGL